jgi:hypothetical protein
MGKKKFVLSYPFYPWQKKNLYNINIVYRGKTEKRLVLSRKSWLNFFSSHAKSPSCRYASGKLEGEGKAKENFSLPLIFTLKKI